MVSGPSPGPAPTAQARRQQFPAYPVQLAEAAHRKPRREAPRVEMP